MAFKQVTQNDLLKEQERIRALMDATNIEFKQVAASINQAANGENSINNINNIDLSLIKEAGMEDKYKELCTRCMELELQNSILQETMLALGISDKQLPTELKTNNLLDFYEEYKSVFFSSRETNPFESNKSEVGLTEDLMLVDGPTYPVICGEEIRIDHDEHLVDTSQMDLRAKIEYTRLLYKAMTQDLKKGQLDSNLNEEEVKAPAVLDQEFVEHVAEGVEDKEVREDIISSYTDEPTPDVEVSPIPEEITPEVEEDKLEAVVEENPELVDEVVEDYEEGKITEEMAESILETAAEQVEEEDLGRSR